MNGSLIHDNSHVLEQWYRLFTNQRMFRSSRALHYWKHVKKVGLPKLKDEDWQYVSLDKFLSHNFVSNVSSIAFSKRINLPDVNLNAVRLVFVDGYFSSLLSDSDTDVWQVTVETAINEKLSLPEPIYPDVFLYLTESLSQEIVYVSLPKRKIANKPLYIVYVNSGNDNENILNTLNYRNHINVESDSVGQVVEHFISLDNKGYFSNSRTSIIVNENANLNYINLISENKISYHFSHNDIKVNEYATVHSTTLVFGSGFTKHQTSSQLNGCKSNLEINSLLLSSENSVSNMQTYLEHNNERCFSRQLHKSVSSSQGRSTFSGTIKISKYASKTNSYMMNRNLSLSNLSEINTKPRLEIYADDVQCSHGATISKINEEQIYYLQSRGIKYKEARKMIICSFSLEIVEMIKVLSIRKMVSICVEEIIEKAMLL